MADLFGKDDPARTILAITPTQRDANRVTVRVGAAGSKRGRVVATLNVRSVADLGLHVGQAWTDRLDEQVQQGAGLDKAMNAAMVRLSRRAMSGWMLSDKLRTLGYEPVVIEAVIERLGELELLDDERFGRALIRELMSRKPAGPMLLRQKLFQKGIRGELADRLVAEATADGDSQLESAVAFARKRAASMRGLDRQVRNRRLYGQLARRGFGPDTIRAAMDAVAADAD